MIDTPQTDAWLDEQTYIVSQELDKALDAAIAKENP